MAILGVLMGFCMSHEAYYQLPNYQNAWRDALQSVAPLLPMGVHLDNLQALRLLPIFAVIIVVDSETLAGHSKMSHNHPDELMLAWVHEQKNWALSFVKESETDADDVPTMVYVEQEVRPLADVKVFRYLLTPTSKSLMSADKRDAAAHIIDEQLTAYLRKKLKPAPNFNYKVNNAGEVVDFKVGTDGKRHHYMDCYILSISQVMRGHKLACFDMDSTLIRQEVIVELAKMAGVGEQVDAVTERAMRGEIDFKKSFYERMALLKGVDANIIEDIKKRLVPQPGAFTAVAMLKALGYRTVLISGGFLPFAEYVAKMLGIDEFYANKLEVVDGKLTGNVIAPIIDGEEKARIVARIADFMMLDLSEVIAIGDGANDLPMMDISDLGVAFRAKPIVQMKADAALNVTGLEGLLYVLGYANLQEL